MAEVHQDLLQQLNDNQREAVTYCDGPQLVIAGAGSGKTRVLTYKIAFLMQEKGLKPWQILALTFTNKAAREMKERIGRLVGPDHARYLQMGTFHSVFSHILRVEAHHIGFSNTFTIYDQSDARSLVKAIIREMQLDEKVYKPSAVADRISMAKNHLVRAGQYGQSSLALDDIAGKRPQVGAVYARYAERCRQANAMDFDDLLVYTYELFQNHAEVLDKYREKFRYVLVDEYQDTNFAQQAIVLQLTLTHQRVCVVGDDAQSIYSFRGANIDNILDFTKKFAHARLFKLEQNYRSTQLIVQAANSLIRKNERQIPKDVYSNNEHGEKVMLKPVYSDREEAIIVCQDIKRLKRQEHCEYSEFAILYRTNTQSRTFEEQMRKDGIPYRIYGGLSFYQRKEIKDVIAYFRVVANPDDEEAMKRIINYPTRGIGQTSIDKIVACATASGVSLWAVISNPASYRLEVSKGTAAKIAAFRQMVDGWRQRAAVEDAYVLGHDIITASGISSDIYSGHNPEDISRQENLNEFLSALQDFVETRREEDMADQTALTDFLQEVSLMTDLDSDDDDTTNKVSLMTIHSAKGLEFPTVFVVGLEENIFPSPLSAGSMRELEEERRLLYVAITRAERHCILTCAKTRFRYGRMESDITPSRFIRDIDPSLISVFSESGMERGLSRQSGSYVQRHERRNIESQNPRPVATQFMADPMARAVPRRPEPPAPAHFRPLSQATPSHPHSGGLRGATPPSVESKGAFEADLREGSVIEHQRFGVGTVVRLEGTGENRKATVAFKLTGVKQLLLKFARITIIS